MIKLKEPLRVIELFAGYGSQSLALKALGIPFVHHYVCEFDKYAMKSYNAVHGTSFEPTDIRDVHASDLNITDTGSHTYLMTYSFPCTDLSVSGKMKGMSREDWEKGESTRSGLLWEVERLLKECEELPQVLFMENVPQVIGAKNRKDFDLWLSFLEEKGYSNFYKVLNAKDYGIPQNRKRCYMFSILGGEKYEFPEPVRLKRRLKDMLEGNVDEKYYLNTEKARKLVDKVRDKGMIGDGTTVVEMNLNGIRKPLENAVTLCARDYKGYGTGFNTMNGVVECRFLGNVNRDDFGAGYAGAVFDPDGISPTLTTMQGGGRQPHIMVNDVVIGGTQEHQSIRNDGVCPTLTASMGTGEAIRR